MSKQKVAPAGNKETAGNSSPDRGIRFLKVAIGGGFQDACLSMLEDCQYKVLEDVAAVVFVDTDVNHLESLPQALKLMLSDVRAADLLEAIREYKERYPGWCILGDLEAKWVALGAAESLPSGLMTRRELGVLVLLYALWRKPAHVRNFLLNPARQLHRVPVTDCWQLNGAALKKHRLDVAYFFSSCGGTGSSLALLQRDLQHWLLSTDGGFTSVNFVAHVLLPGPMLHRANEAQAIKANTWAFFLELMQRYKQKLGPLQLGRYLVPRKNRPFRHVYLYDESNSEEQVFTSREQVNEVVKEIDKLMTLGPEGQEYQARLVDYHLAYPNIFSSAGCWRLVYPHEAILQAFALRSGAAWINEWPLKRLGSQDLQRTAGERCNDFLNRHTGLRDIPDLTRDTKGGLLRINLAGAKDRPRNQLAGVIEDVGQRQLEEHRDTLAELAGQNRARLAAAVVAETETLLQQPGGLDLAEAFLHNLFTHLAQHKQAMDEQLDRARRARQQRREQLESMRHRGFWGRFAFNRRDAYLKRAQRTLDGHLRELRQQARLELVKQLIAAVQQLQAECAGWRDTLVRLSSHLADALETHWREAEKQRPICVEWVVCRDEIDHMFDELGGEVLEQAAKGPHLQWMADEASLILQYPSVVPSHVDRWAVVSPTGSAMHTNYFRRFWAGRVDHSVEDILVRRGESPEEILAYLEHKGAPLIKIDDTTQIPAEKTLKILSSETTGFWRGSVGQTGLSIAATGNRHCVSLLYTVHGFNPLDGLMASQTWHQSYVDELSTGRSPHVFPDVQIDHDLTPGDDFGFKRLSEKVRCRGCHSERSEESLWKGRFSREILRRYAPQNDTFQTVSKPMEPPDEPLSE